MAGQGEARHHIWHDQQFVAVELLDVCAGLGRIEDGQHGIGVGVVDIGIGDDGVQNRFD